MEGSSSSGRIVLPDGARVGAGRETSQANQQGTIVAGTSFPVTLKGGTQTTVFIPHSDLEDLQAVQAIFDARLNGIKAITG